MSTIRVAVLGLDNSHPLVDLRHLAQRRDVAPVVLAEDGPRLEDLRREFPTLEHAPDLEALLSTTPDAVLVTLRPRRLGGFLGRVLDAGAPVFLNKPGFTRRVHWSTAEASVRSATRLLTASVLRFAPAVAALGPTPPAAPGEARIRVAHGIRHWQRAENAWQADPSDGGGVVAALVYHGVELAHAVTGRVPQPMALERHSEERFVLRFAWPDGGGGVMELDASSDAERYLVEVEQGGVRRELELDGTGEDPFGYRGAMDAFLRLCDGDAPLDSALMASVIEACVRTAELPGAIDQSQQKEQQK